MIRAVFQGEKYYLKFLSHCRPKMGLIENDPLDSSKLKESADNKLRLDENSRKFSKWVENTVGKVEIARFPTVFSKELYCRHVKTRACLGKE